MVEEIKVILSKILKSIYDGDAAAYEKLVSGGLTCFEPQTMGHLLEGLPFHLFLIEKTNIPLKNKVHYEIIHPIYRVRGDMAYVAYTILISKIDHGEPTFSINNETRIFEKEKGVWKMIHFHRSL